MLNASLAIEPKIITISQYEALASDIEIAKEQAVESFEYNSPRGDKLARSYISGLRSIRNSIEKARKEAKSYSLEYGRAVDAQAKQLDGEILELITPHQNAIDEIVRREKNRIAAHQATLVSITTIVQLGSAENAKSSFITGLIADLNNIDTAGLEEFRLDAEAEIENGLRLLLALHAAAERAERDEAIEAAAAAHLAEQERLIELAETELRIRESEAQARQEIVERAKIESELLAAKCAEAENRILVLEQQQAIEKQTIAKAEQNLCDFKADMKKQLCAAITGKTKFQLVDALLDGSFHPAVFIDWSRVEVKD